ncbi:MAG: hypothetical protein PHO00_00990 [bacterium]|nr:hypothetical protein [bacterium]
MAIALAEAETGVRGGKGDIPLCCVAKSRARRWTEEEDRFVLENHGRLSEKESAKRLKRTLVAVHIHKEREMKLKGISKSPSIMTAEQVANGLGKDSKSIHLLMDRGLMPCRRLPSSRVMRVIDRFALLKWIVNPENWLYFRPTRVGNFCRKSKRGYGDYDYAFWENARAAVLKACRRWKDEWLTPGQAAHRLKIKASGTRYINVAIKKGILKAKRWGNWWVRKSDLPSRGKTINFKGDIVQWDECD